MRTSAARERSPLRRGICQQHAARRSEAVRPQSAKVKGGIDLVGDAYDANVAGSVPVPDPNPLDCNGHGSHTSGTATVSA